MNMKGFLNITVRFYVWDEDMHHREGGWAEVSEDDFLFAEGSIEYERTIMSVGQGQLINLRKNPFKKGE
jgi:hypothetical protein